MRITSGKVVSGKVVIEDDSLPEGTTVTVIAPEGSEEFELSTDDETALRESIEQANAGQVIPASEVLAGLKSRA